MQLHEVPAAAEKPSCLLHVNLRNVEQKSVHFILSVKCHSITRCSHSPDTVLLFTVYHMAIIPPWIGSCAKLRYVLYLCNIVTSVIWQKGTVHSPQVDLSSSGSDY